MDSTDSNTTAGAVAFNHPATVCPTCGTCPTCGKQVPTFGQHGPSWPTHPSWPTTPSPTPWWPYGTIFGTNLATADPAKSTISVT